MRTSMFFSLTPPPLRTGAILRPMEAAQFGTVERPVVHAVPVTQGGSQRGMPNNKSQISQDSRTETREAIFVGQKKVLQ